MTTDWDKFSPDEEQFRKFTDSTRWERLKAWATYKPRHAKRAIITLRENT